MEEIDYMLSQKEDKKIKITGRQEGEALEI